MLVEFSIEQPERLWSNESYHENFQEAHSAFQTSMRTRAGVHVIAPEVFGNARLLHWELLGGCVCLQEQGLERRFPDSAVCIRLGASPILQVYFESSSSASQQEGQGQEQGLRVTAWACFLQQDGSLHSFELAAQGRGQSLLEQLVAAREGRLVTLGDTLTATLNSFGLSSARSRGLGLGLGSSAALAASAATSLRLRSAVVQTLPADRDILSAVWLSPRALLLGLSAGDSLLVQMPLAGGQATEQLLRDRGELQAMWAGLLGAVSPTDLDTIALAALPTLQGGLAVSLAVNRSGEVRVWSPGRAQVSAQVSLPDLLHAVGALPVLPTSAAGGRKPSDKGVQLQECLPRLVLDAGPPGGQSDVVLCAVGVLPAQELYSGALQQPSTAPFLYASQGLAADSPPLQQQSWRIALLAWRCGGKGGDRPRLISQPLAFPLGELQVVGPGLVFRSAALTDLQLSTDAAKDELVVVSQWRAQAVEQGGEELVLFERVVARVVIPLGALRRRGFEEHQRPQDLFRAPPMQIVAHSGAHERLRLRREDELVFAQMQERALALLDEEDVGAEQEELRAVKAALLRRVFLLGRFCMRAVAAAYDSFQRRTYAEAGAGAGTEESKGLTAPFSFSSPSFTSSAGGASGGIKGMGRQELQSRLPLLVLQVCGAWAEQRFREGLSSLQGMSRGRGLLLEGGAAAGAEGVRYLRCLQDAARLFLAGCDAAAAQLEKGVASGPCTLLATGQGDVSAVAAVWGASAVYGGSCALAYRGGGVGLVGRAHLLNDLGRLPSAETLPSTPTRAQDAPRALAQWLLGAVQERTAGGTFATSFAELDVLLERQVREGDLSATALEWVPKWFAPVSSALRGLLPELLNRVQGVGVGGLSGAGAASCFELLVDPDFCAQVEPLPVVGGAVGGEAVFAAAAGVAQQVRMLLRQRLHVCKLTLALLQLLLTSGRSALSAEAYAAVRDFCVPRAVSALLHLQTLLWLDGLRPTSNSILRCEVELAGLFPLSAGAHSARASAIGCDEGVSVLESFVRSACAQTMQALSSPSSVPEALSQLLLEGALQGMRLSGSSALSAFLFAEGQYVALGRCAAVSRLNSACVVENATLLPAAATPLSRLLVALCGCRQRLSQLVAEYLELMRLQWLCVQRRRSLFQHVDEDPLDTPLLPAIRSKAGQLLAVFSDLDGLKTEAAAAAEGGAEGACSGALLSAGLHAYCSDLQASLSAQQPAQGGLARAFLDVQLEGLAALLDALSSIAPAQAQDEQGSLLLAVIRARTLRPSDGSVATVPAYPAGSAAWALRHLCEGGSGDLGTVLQAKLLSDVLELVERSLPLLPRRMGASLAVEASLLLVEHVNCALDPLPVHAPCAGSYSAALLAELRGAWTKVFEGALLHGDMYAEALDALLHLAELEEQEPELPQGRGGGRAVPWRDCLRTLVAQACDCGRLGWLCSVPDRQLLPASASAGSAQGDGLSLSDAVASTLELLGATLDVPLALSDAPIAPQAVNWAECLFVFQLAHSKFRDAARALHTFVRRLDGEQAKAGPGAARRLAAQVGPLAAALGALLVLPGEQQYLLFRDGAGAEAGLDWRDARELALLFSVRRAALSLAQDVQGQNAALGPVELTAALSSPERLVLALSNTGRLQEALSLAWRCDAAVQEQLREAAPGLVLAAGSGSDERLLDVPVVALALDCADACSLSGPGSKYGFLLLDCYRRSPRPSRWLPGTASLWQELSAIALFADTSLAASTGGLRWRKAVMRAALSRPSTSASASASCAAAPVPRALIDGVGGFSSSTSAQTGSGGAASPGDAGALLRLLVEGGLLGEACQCATRLVEGAQVAPSRSAHRSCLPYGALDQLISACEQQLQRGAGVRLELLFSRLQAALSTHFKLLLQGEAGPNY